jgi:hypothetical protein
VNIEIRQYEASHLVILGAISLKCPFHGFFFFWRMVNLNSRLSKNSESKFVLLHTMEALVEKGVNAYSFLTSF